MRGDERIRTAVPAGTNDCLYERVRIAAEREEHLLVRARSYGDFDGILIHFHAAHVLRELMRGAAS